RRQGEAETQTVVADVNTDSGFAPHRAIAGAPGFRAVQSTPLVDLARTAGRRPIHALSTPLPPVSPRRHCFCSRAPEPRKRRCAIATAAVLHLWPSRPESVTSAGGPDPRRGRLGARVPAWLCGAGPRLARGPQHTASR